MPARGQFPGQGRLTRRAGIAIVGRNRARIVQPSSDLATGPDATNATTLLLSYFWSAPITVTVGQAVETDEAQPITAAKRYAAIGQASDAESAQTITPAHGVAVGQATGGAASPDTISDLGAWWDTSDATTITESGGLVSQITDKSGNGNTMTASGSTRPTTGSRTIGGVNVFDFDGTDDQMVGPAMVSPVERTAFAVVTFDALSGNGDAVITTTNQGWSWRRSGDTGPVRAMEVLDEGIAHHATPGGTTIADGSTHLISVRWTRTGYETRIDGVLAGTNTDSYTPAASGNLALGGGSSGTRFNGALAEPAFYTRALTDDEWDAVEAYYLSKYGLGGGSGGANESAQAITPRKGAAVGQASDSESAQPVTPAKRVVVGQAGLSAIAFPDDITGLAAAWDFSDTATITESGGAVSQVDGAHGTSIALTQGTGAQQPTTGTRTLNGLNVLDFAADRLKTGASDLSAVGAEWTTFVVIVPDIDTTQWHGYLGDVSSWEMMAPHGTGVMGLYALGGLSGSSPPVVAGTTYLTEFVSGPSSQSEWMVNGTSYQTGSNTATIAGLSVGAHWSDADYFDGTIAEVLVYDGVLSAGDRERVRDYLNGKWAVYAPIPEGTDEAAQAIAHARQATVGQASEADAAQPITAQRRYPVGQAAETDEAQPITRSAPSLTVTVNQASETDTAQAATLARRYTVGQASETDGAGTVTAAEPDAVGTATETDEAQPITSRKRAAVGQATETGSGNTITPTRQYPVGQASETDASGTITPARPYLVGQAAEVDAGQALNRQKRIAVAQAAESDEAQPITARRVYPVGQSSETDAGQPITAAHLAAVGQASETDAGQAITRQKRIAVGVASDAESAQPVTSAKRASVGQATETDEAQSVTRGGVSTQVGQAAESGTAGAITPARRYPVAQAQETGSAQPLTAARAYPAAQATETDEAQGVAHLRQAPVGQAAEAGSAQAITAAKRAAVGQASSGATAQAIRSARAYPAGMATEPDAAQPVGHARAATVGTAQETDSSQPLTARKPIPVGQATEADTAAPAASQRAYPLGQSQVAEAALPIAVTKRMPVGQAAETAAAGTITAQRVYTVGQTLETDTAIPVTFILGIPGTAQGYVWTNSAESYVRFPSPTGAAGPGGASAEGRIDRSHVASGSVG